MGRVLVEAHGLRKVFLARGRSLVWGRKNPVHAVDGVDLAIQESETVGLVGETGSGKTTVGRMLVRVMEPTAGQILFDGNDVARLKRRALRDFRRHVQIVFQNPYSSLNPRKTVAQSISLPLRVHGLLDRRALGRRVAELLTMVGLEDAVAGRYPHQLSGGQRQRVVIARALALEPRFLVLDEPVSALDVSVQAQILRLLKSLQHRLGLAYLFISHDINVVGMISDRVAVMYNGKIVESGPAERLFTEPHHEYTRLLLAARLAPAAARVIRAEPEDLQSHTS